MDAFLNERERGTLSIKILLMVWLRLFLAMLRLAIDWCRKSVSG
jgi:hypothetical protein